MHFCSFVLATVQNEETKSWGAESFAVESGIPTLQLASFAVDPDEK
jgi:hypothetical protein